MFLQRQQNGAASIISEIRILIITGLSFLTWIKKKKWNRVMSQEADECLIPVNEYTIYSVSWARFTNFLSLGENTIALQLLIYNPQISKPHTHTHKKTFFKETHLAVKSNWSELICHKILPWTSMKLFTVCVYFIYCEYTCFATQLWIYSSGKV